MSECLARGCWHVEVPGTEVGRRGAGALARASHFRSPAYRKCWGLQGIKREGR